MSMMEAVKVLSGRFRGTMVGALMGDCFGAPFEGDEKVSPTVLNSYFRRLLDPDLKVPYKSYTDDTAMTRCIAQSLIQSKGFNATDMARKFVKEYYAEPNRGYGANIVDVFAALRANKFKDVFTSAGLQFGGRGSYGNGAAMRVAPVGLFCYSAEEKDMIEMARDSALITHANRLGYNGAVLQCFAVHQALHIAKDKLDSVKFVETLIVKMKSVETPTEDDILDEGENPYTYVKKLEKVLDLMERGSAVNTRHVADELGVYIAAHLSVPAAIYSFIRAAEPIPDIEAENPFQRTLQYAISLGGDTDTIASMAGSIAGAYYGIEGVPKNLKRHCEALSDAEEMGEKLFQLSQPEGSGT